MLTSDLQALIEWHAQPGAGSNFLGYLLGARASVISFLTYRF